MTLTRLDSLVAATCVSEGERPLTSSGELIKVAHAAHLSDDPEPTDYKHFEIYGFNSGTRTQNGTDLATGIDFNYGAATDIQLTATLPAGFAFSPTMPTRFGASNVELAIKYRFLHQTEIGWDVAFFPRVFLPTSTNQIGDKEASLLLPFWIQRDLGSGWTTFGGGGCQIYSGSSGQNSCMAGGVLSRKISDNLQIGGELFYQAPSAGSPASTSVGLGGVYDINQTYHLLGYVRTGIQNRSKTDQISWYTAVLVTF